MSPVESAIAISLLLSLGLTFVGLREGSIDNIDSLHRILLINAAIAGVAYGASTGRSIFGALFWLVLIIGATECGHWLGLFIDKILPERKGDDLSARGWKFRNDPVGCILAIMLGLAALTALGITADEDEDYEGPVL